jgi:hypothetical protein
MDGSIEKRLVCTVRVDCYFGFIFTGARAQPVAVSAILVLVWLSKDYFIPHVFGVFECESAFHCLSAI